MDRKKSFVLKGHICYSDEKKKLHIKPNSYAVCKDGVCQGVFEKIPQKFASFEVRDMGDVLVIPGLTDLHANAPQYAFRGLGMDLELLEWLNTHTFPEEARYADLEYAQRAYGMYVEELKKSAVTRAVIFGTLHVEATEILMDLLEESGLETYAGKVNMDRNGGKNLEEASAQSSAAETRRWLQETEGKYRHTRPILTPRFIPACSDELMAELRTIQKEYGLPVQSHLSENPQEVAWVKELCPKAKSYSDAYFQAGLFGGTYPAVMAHCIWVDEEEIQLMKEQGVYVAHCPQSNANLSSGIAPVRKFLSAGVSIGLGSDMAAGSNTSILRAMADAVQCSKLRWRLVDSEAKPLTFPEVFYMGTLGGGSFFGNVGSFLPGYAFDALVLDDTSLPQPRKLEVSQRLERFIYLGDEQNIVCKYVNGVCIR